MCHYWYLFGIKLPPNLELTSNSPYSAFCFKYYLTWRFFRLLLWNTRSKTYIKFLDKNSLIYNWLPCYIPAWLYRQFQHSPKKIYVVLIDWLHFKKTKKIMFWSWKFKRASWPSGNRTFSRVFRGREALAYRSGMVLGVVCDLRKE